MTRGETSQRRLDDVTPRVLFGIFIEKAIRTGRGDRCCEDTLALGTSPFAGLLARFESFHGTGRQGGTRSLSKALLAALTMVAITVTTATARA